MLFSGGTPCVSERPFRANISFVRAVAVCGPMLVALLSLTGAPTTLDALVEDRVLQEPPDTTTADPYPLDSLRAVVDELRGGPPGPLGVALQELTYGYVFHGRHDDAVEAGREAVRLLETAGDSAQLALTHNELGLAHWNRVQYDSAVVHFSRARELWTALDDGASLGRVYNNLGAAHYQWGNFELALESFLRSLEFRREAGEEAGQALALTNVGLTYFDWGLHDEAREAFDEAIALADRIEYPFGQAYARLNRGELHLEQGEWDRAEALFRASIEYYGADDASIPPSDAAGGRILNQLGLAEVELGRDRPRAAIEILEETLELASSVESPIHVSRTLLELGRAHQALGDYDHAAEYLTEGLAEARARDQRPHALDLLAALSEVEELRGRPGPALAHLREHVALRDLIFDQGAVQRVAAMEAETELARRERENALLREEQRVREAVIERQRLIAILAVGLLVTALLLLGVLLHFNRRGRIRREALARTNASLEAANRQLREAQSEVQTLKGLIPICSHCKRVRDDEGYWESVESYITSRSEALFSHSICQECGPSIYGDDWSPDTAPTGSAAHGDGAD